MAREKVKGESSSKVLSLNIRGFAAEGKFGWVKGICVKERPSIAAFQETKCRSLNDGWVEAQWGNSEFGFVQKEAIGSAGVRVTTDTTSFEVSNAMGGDYFLAIRGIWRNSGNESIIVNVYGPHNDADKKVFLHSLGGLVSSYEGAWLLCGDFNEVREDEDILNCVFSQARANRFNEFIEKNNLIEIPLNGKKFTRVSDDGSKFSKIDRFFVTDSFIQLWEDLSIISLERFLSDHSPLLLRDKVIDYGPKPFKVFDEWFNREGMDKIIEEAWEDEVKGRRLDCNFRDRLKNVKFALKNGVRTRLGVLTRN
ncbi:uncharacterized protein [Rutidosis leptorrhynchoides]|uniref:uncharacterized protein n=1 Tax=Rutidosis leptorrhynchoides TaxID=125765 RepID=UPI003A99EC99